MKKRRKTNRWYRDKVSNGISKYCSYYWRLLTYETKFFRLFASTFSMRPVPYFYFWDIYYCHTWTICDNGIPLVPVIDLVLFLRIPSVHLIVNPRLPSHHSFCLVVHLVCFNTITIFDNLVLSSFSSLDFFFSRNLYLVLFLLNSAIRSIFTR